MEMIRCSPHNLNVLGYCELKIRYLTTNLPYILGSGQFQRILKFSGGGGGGGGGGGLRTAQTGSKGHTGSY